MSRSRCEKEMEVVSAVRTEAWTTELKDHLRNCASCIETEQVAKVLLQHAAILREEQGPMAADRIWRRAQVQKQELAVKRAMRPLIFMRGLSSVGVIGLVIWLLHRFWSWNYRELMRDWSAVGNVMASVGMGLAILCVTMGAWYLLNEDKRNDSSVSSM